VTLNRQFALLMIVMVTAVGALASAQAKPAAKKPRVFFVEPKNNATVLKRIVRKPKTRSHRTNFGLQDMTHHFTQPSTLSYLHIIVQKGEHFASGGGCSPIDQSAEIE